MKTFALKCIPILIICWYIFVLFLPKLSGGVPAIPSSIKSYMYKSANKTYDQVKSEIKSRPWNNGKYAYQIELSKVGLSDWTLKATPKQKKVYKKDFLERIIWLDFRTHTLPDLYMESTMTFPENS